MPELLDEDDVRHLRRRGAAPAAPVDGRAVVAAARVRRQWRALGASAAAVLALALPLLILRPSARTDVVLAPGNAVIHGSQHPLAAPVLYRGRGGPTEALALPQPISQTADLSSAATGRSTGFRGMLPPLIWTTTSCCSWHTARQVDAHIAMAE